MQSDKKYDMFSNNDIVLTYLLVLDYNLVLLSPFPNITAVHQPLIRQGAQSCSPCSV